MPDRRFWAGLLGTIGALLALAPGAGAQGAPSPSPAPQPTRFAVPLDHDGGQVGRTLSISYLRLPATGPRRGTVVVLSGGPGQPAIDIAPVFAAGPLRSLRKGYDLVFADQRGSGLSSALSCSTAPRGTFGTSASASASTDPAADVARCAAEVGDARRYFSTYQTVLDLESLRQQLGVEKLIPLGISYGGQVAGDYARRFPDRTQALILDSASPIEGIDALAALPSLALPRVLREVCFPPGCATTLGAPQALLAAAARRMARGDLRGRVVLPDGKRESARIGLSDLYTLVRASDTDPALRTALPSALEAAARGDAAPLLRLAVQTEDGGTEQSGINEIRFLATACTEGRLPWEPTSDPATRGTLLAQALSATAARYAPFPPDLVAPETTATMCLGWPATERAPYAPSPTRGPNVPVLVLGGREDLRTPLEDQRRIAAQFPNAKVVAVPNVGHSVLGNDPTTCASGAVSAFLYGFKRPPCPATPRPVPLALPVFRSLSEVPPAGGDAPKLVEQTAVATDLTLRDVVRQIAALGMGTAGTPADVEARTIRLGGLRGGRMELRRRTLTLRDYEIVTGVRVSGRLDEDLEGTLTVAGRAPGTLRVAKTGTLRGTLGGSTITYRPKAVAAG